MAGISRTATSTSSVDQHRRGRFRPDLVVHCPAAPRSSSTAKLPPHAFLRAAESGRRRDEEARLCGARPASLARMWNQLAKKEYWNSFDPSPEFVVAFVPGDPLLAAASNTTSADRARHGPPALLLTTPTTLIALAPDRRLRLAAGGPGGERSRVQRQGAELYERLRVLAALSKLQRHLSGSVEAFNDAVGSIESPRTRHGAPISRPRRRGPWRKGDRRGAPVVRFPAPPGTRASSAEQTLDEVPEPLALFSTSREGPTLSQATKADGFSRRPQASDAPLTAAGDRTLDRAVCHAHRQGIQRAPRGPFVHLFTTMLTFLKPPQRQTQVVSQIGWAQCPLQVHCSEGGQSSHHTQRRRRQVDRKGHHTMRISYSAVTVPRLPTALHLSRRGPTTRWSKNLPRPWLTTSEMVSLPVRNHPAPASA